jgi:Phage tail sheath protein subtilisin-like domain/Phage tail sheath C-terminal domain
MAETVLPGVSIEVRDEGLIVPTAITVGNLGVVGTASKGPVDQPVTLASYAEARARFGEYDLWQGGTADELTLTRALELAFQHGATTAIAVRVSAKDNDAAKKAERVLSAGGATPVKLVAKSPGTWGNDLEVRVEAAAENAFVEDEDVQGLQLAVEKVIQSARNRIRIRPADGGSDRRLAIVYDTAVVPNPGQVVVDLATGALTLAAGLPGADKVIASYMADSSKAVQVTIRLGEAKEEVYPVVSGRDLIRDLAASAWVEGVVENNAHLDELLDLTPSFDRLTGGSNGAAGADYQAGLDLLENQDAHIIVAAGQDERFGDELAAHCAIASSDLVQRNRIGVIGCGSAATKDAFLARALGHPLASDRVIFVAPGIKTADRAASPPVDVALPGSYAAAAVAGLLASLPAHVSLTNKTLFVGGLEYELSRAELEQLVKARVLALEKRQGIRIVQGLTSATNTAFRQITTRRIVDFASFGVRSAANPFIGRLNNERVRGSLFTGINGFLAKMVQDEMLIAKGGYDNLTVSATRDQEIRGIVQVTMTLRPVFSIDQIHVVIFLQ